MAPIVSVADADEAVRLANGTTMGLVAYVYTGDLAKGLRIAEQLESGMVGLNKGIVSDPARALRRREGVRHRPRGRPRGDARLHGDEVHRHRLVGRTRHAHAVRRRRAPR